MAKSKVVKLPFVVRPRLEPIVDVIGNENCGQIEIIRRGYLTVAEKTFVTASLSGDDSIFRLRHLALEISRETGNSQSKVLDDIARESNYDGYLEPYSDKILERLTEMQIFQDKRNIITATCLLIHRIDDEWTVERTMDELHPDLMQALANLFEEEEKGNLEALERKYAEKTGDETVESSEGK